VKVGEMARRRSNPDDSFDIVLLLGLGLGGLFLFRHWKANQEAPMAGSAPAGATGTITSAAAGETFTTSSPTGHGQIYV
jgi:hypothetical protein